jgi:hypothetical protein
MAAILTAMHMQRATICLGHNNAMTPTRHSRRVIRALGKNAVLQMPLAVSVAPTGQSQCPHE